MPPPDLPFGIPTPLPPAWRNRGVRAPVDLYAAVHIGKAGIIHGAAGPFLDEADARAHVAAEFGGHGQAVPFELVLRSPPKPPPAPPGQGAADPPPPGESAAAPAHLVTRLPAQPPPDGRPPGRPPGREDPTPPPAGRPATP